MGFLIGKKTYLVAILTAALTFLKMAGHISEEVYQQLLALLAAGGIATVRSAISGLDRRRN